MDEKRAIALLKKYAPDEEAFKDILGHGKRVQQIALKLAKGVEGIDIDLIKTASLLHDIGRFKYWSREYPPPEKLRKEMIKHGIEGGEILRKEGYPKHANVAERHIGAGITKKDIKKHKLDLPLKCYVPLTKEEKIIAHADNLAEGSREVKFEKVVERFKKKLGDGHAQRLIKLKKDVDNLKNGGYSKAKKRAN